MTRDEQLKHQAKEAFKNHKISKRSEGRWLLQRPYKDGEGWDCVFATEVISLWRGQLYVGGDIDFVIFAYYSDTSDHEDKVRWMGECKDFGWYVMQKAEIGTGSKLVRVYDREEAEEFLKDQLKQVDEQGYNNPATVKEAFQDLIDRLPDDQHEFLDGLYKIDADLACDCGDSCMVAAPRVYFAHAVLARLCQLLDEEKDEDAPQVA
jgi:hypothetical protein